VQRSGNPFTMYNVGIKTATDTVTTGMFTTGHLMAFTGHVFTEKLVITPSFNNPTAAYRLITPEQKVTFGCH